MNCPQNENVLIAQERANESASYLRELLDEAPEDIAPYISDIKEHLNYVTDRETVKEAINELARFDTEWLRDEADRLMQSAPGENLDLYIDKLSSMFDNLEDGDLRDRLKQTIEEQVVVRDERQALGELPVIDPETSELPLVITYMKEHDDIRQPAQWDFVREVELDDGLYYSVVVSFSDGSSSTYYIRGGAVQLVSTTGD